jgi:hypothetical protein
MGGGIAESDGDAATHDFPPATFDLVFSRYGVMLFAHPVAAFGNIRAMKPGGGRG